MAEQRRQGRLGADRSTPTAATSWPRPAGPCWRPGSAADRDAAVWNNRNFTVEFEPGSVFKIFTTASLLRHGAIDTATVFDCSDRRVRRHQDPQRRRPQVRRPAPAAGLRHVQQRLLRPGGGQPQRRGILPGPAGLRLRPGHERCPTRASRRASCDQPARLVGPLQADHGHRPGNRRHAAAAGAGVCAVANGGTL